MTMRSFGRVVPIHIDMLQLAGYVVDYDKRDIRPAKSDKEFLRTVRQGRADLRRQCGSDFGYDLAAWRDFLLAAPDDEFGYRHPYAFRRVDRAIQRAMSDPRRADLIEQLGE
jgi:hypothetical protein